MSEPVATDPAGDPAAHRASDPEAATPGSSPTADTWRRLSPRMLLINPVKVVGQFAFPALVAFVGISQGDRGMPWWAVPIVVIGTLVLGAVPWLTTFYRTTDTQLQLRQGLLNKRTKTAPLERIRSVDLEASLLHRIVGVSKVQIGTGVDDDRITLDAVSREVAATLRSSLLSRRTPMGDPSSETAPEDPAEVSPELPAPTRPAQVLAEIDWSWIRFAPFSLARLVLLAAAAGVLGQVGDELPVADVAGSAWAWVLQFALPLVVGGLFFAGLTSWVTVAVTGYVVQWWNMRLTRDAGSLHLTAGLLTTRSITVEEQRVRGVRLTEPVLLRLVGGAELAALATGVGSGGVTAILPPCPDEVARRVGADVLERPEPMTVPLVSHGPRARRRAWLRHLDNALVPPVVLLVAMIWVDLAWWVPLGVFAVSALLAVVVAESAYRNLGHATTSEHLVAGSGELTRVRTVLENDGIIGWVMSASWFQRRAGLVTLTATTAAGSERVVVRDIPLAAAIHVADRSTPELLKPFLASAPGRADASAPPAV